MRRSCGETEKKNETDISSRFSHVVRAEYQSSRRFCQELSFIR
ncbi:hypothetical protein BACIH_3127 [Bacillus amyloliquefaciens]|nr:hypothetical protein U471_31480 [Bacillus amyloliquefaciens CC178]AHZ17322.1 hypothetical protein V529_32960 [Bacillus velezensis SQR9]QEY90442.1 hypothetical protein BACIT_2561 [Bacillus amyloliquefaciens]QEY94824.1 hypothetical protein BACIH_3127 [Bacillus amyloliquefaciens]